MYTDRAATVLSLKVLHRVAGAATPFLVIRFFAIFPERRHSMRLWDLLTLLTIALAIAMAVTPGGDAWWPAAASTLSSRPSTSRRLLPTSSILSLAASRPRTARL